MIHIQSDEVAEVNEVTNKRRRSYEEVEDSGVAAVTSERK